MKHHSRLTPAILVLSLLAATPVFPQAHQGTAPRTTSFAEALHSFLPAFLGRMWADLVCGLDPFGTCDPARAQAVRPGRPLLTALSGDLGCVIDPFGKCASAASSTNAGH